MPNVVNVQKIPQQQATPEDIIATFCYYYQQYTFAQARRVSYKRITQMLNIAKKEHARKMLDLLQIAVAPHGKKGNAKSLFDKFSAIINE